MDDGPSSLTLTFVWPPSPDPPAFLTATELLFWVALARLGTRHAVHPLRLTAPEPHEPSAAAVHDYIGRGIEQGSAVSITFSSEDAERPFLTANQRMWDFFEPELRRRLSELQTTASTTERVRASLLELLPAGDATMDAVARSLGMSNRTLQRRLRGEQTNFQELLSDVRESLALHYLRSSAMPAAEISFLLGYADPNSFYRAFQGWTGLTPETARAQARN